MKNIIRYSIYGFKPQYQSYHLDYVHYHMNNFNILDFHKYSRFTIQKLHDKHLAFYQEHYEDFKEGI